MIYAEVEGGRSAGARVMGRDIVLCTEARGGASSSSCPGRHGSRQVQGGATLLRGGLKETVMHRWLKTGEETENQCKKKIKLIERSK